MPIFRTGCIEDNSPEKHWDEVDTNEDYLQCLKEAIQEKKMFIEVIKDDTPIHPYFDIDCTDEISDEYKCGLFDKIRELWGVEKDDLMIMEREHPKKSFSAHILIPSLVTTKAKMREFIDEEIQLPIGRLSFWGLVLDKTVYNGGLSGHLANNLTPKRSRKNPDKNVIDSKVHIWYKGEHYNPEDDKTEILKDTLVCHINGDEKEWVPPEKVKPVVKMKRLKLPIQKITKIEEEKDSDMSSSDSTISVQMEEEPVDEVVKITTIIDRILKPEEFQKYELWNRLVRFVKSKYNEGHQSVWNSYIGLVKRMPNWSSNADVWTRENDTILKKRDKTELNRDKTITIGSIIYWAKNETTGNPQLYDELYPKKEFKFPEDKLKNFDIKYLCGLKYYSQQKAYVENFCAKILYCKAFMWRDEIKYMRNGFPVESCRVIMMVKQDIVEMLETVYSKDKTTSDGEARPFTSVWLKDETIRSYKEMDFQPTNTIGAPENEVGGRYNTFLGYNPIIKKDLADSKHLKFFHQVGLNLFGGNPEYYKWGLNYIADMIQNPQRKAQNGLVLIGNQGIGKGYWISCIRSMMDPMNSICTGRAEDLFGTHAEAIQNKLLINWDEVALKDTANLESDLKRLITEESFTVNPKNIRPYAVTNYSRVIFTTNNRIPMKMDVASRERRWVIMDGTSEMLKPKYTKKVWEQAKHQSNTPEFISSLYDFFNTYPVIPNMPRPFSEAYKRVYNASIPPIATFLIEYITNQEYTDETTEDFKLNRKYSRQLSISAFDFFESFKSYKMKNNISDKHISRANDFSSEITNAPYLEGTITKKRESQGVVYHLVPKNVYNALHKIGYCIDDEDEPSTPIASQQEEEDVLNEFFSNETEAKDILQPIKKSSFTKICLIE